MTMDKKKAKRKKKRKRKTDDHNDSEEEKVSRKMTIFFQGLFFCYLTIDMEINTGKWKCAKIVFTFIALHALDVTTRYGSMTDMYHHMYSPPPRPPAMGWRELANFR